MKKIFIVRAKRPDGGYDYGTFLAYNMADLFWAAAEWTDPYSCQFRELEYGYWFCRDGAGQKIYGEAKELGLRENEWRDNEAPPESEDAWVLWRDFVDTDWNNCTWRQKKPKKVKS